MPSRGRVREERDVPRRLTLIREISRGRRGGGPSGLQSRFYCPPPFLEDALSTFLCPAEIHLARRDAFRRPLPLLSLFFVLFPIGGSLSFRLETARSARIFSSFPPFRPKSPELIRPLPRFRDRGTSRESYHRQPDRRRARNLPRHSAANSQRIRLGK